MKLRTIVRPDLPLGLLVIDDRGVPESEDVPWDELGDGDDS